MIKVGDEVLYMVNSCIFEVKKVNSDGTLTIESEFEIYQNVSVGDVFKV